MTDLTPNHPAVEVAARVGRVSDEAEIAASEAYAQGVGERPFSQRMRTAITAALPHLTADDLPAHLVRDIQVRTIRATARAVTYEEDDTPQGHDWDRATFSAWLNELADNIERDDTA